MTRYTKTFDLNVADLELVEESLRDQIKALADRKHALSDTVNGEVLEFDYMIKRLNSLLGKLHNQKIWYSQVNQTGLPLG